MNRLGVLLATSLGVGYVPFAPGTAGSAVGVVLYVLTRHWPSSWQVGLLIGVAVVGVWASGVAARHFEKDDPGYVVIDEVAGQLMTLLLLDVGLVGATIGFLVFRVLDIVKPWPARQLEDLHGGAGIMADDLMAGAYGWLIMWAAVTFVPWLR